MEVRLGSLSATAAALRSTVTMHVAQERGVLTVLALQTPLPADGGERVHVVRKAPIEAAYVKVFARTPAGVRLPL